MNQLSKHQNPIVARANLDNFSITHPSFVTHKYHFLGCSVIRTFHLSEHPWSQRVRITDFLLYTENYCRVANRYLPAKSKFLFKSSFLPVSSEACNVPDTYNYF